MDPKSFTLRPPNVIKRLITPIRICVAHIPSADKQHPRMLEINTLWDTGASCTTISKKVAQSLNLIPFRFEEVYHAQGKGVAPLYKVNILLPNSIEFLAMPVLEGDLFDFDALIGMDIISQGDFALTNRDGKTVFSFQIPSTHLYDFVKQDAATKLNGKKKVKKK